MRVGFAGTPAFAVTALAAIADAGFTIPLVLTRPDKPKGRGLKIEPSPVSEEARRRGLPVLRPASLKTPEGRSQALAVPLDVLVVAAYGLILPPEVLAWPRHGCLNIHASKLPRWRGAAPIQRAILAGDQSTGITIMQMDAGLDTGPMLLVRPIAIGPRESGGELHDRLALLGADAIVAAIDAWQSGALAPRPQPADGATYAAKIRKEEARIDWTQPAVAIDRQVRAFNPWPVAETSWEGRQLRVWQAEPAPPVEANADAAPGTVLESGAGRIVVATGDGALRLTQVQSAGRRAMTAAEFLNASSLRGARLG